MAIKQKLFYIFSGAISAFAVWLSILFTTTPEQADWIAFVSLYGSQTIWLAGFLTFIILPLKVAFFKTHAPELFLTSSLRQGFLVAVWFSLLIFFQQLEVLNYWEAILLSVIIALSEAVFQSKFWNEA